MTIFFLVFGLGEYAQAQAVANKLTSNGHRVWFITENELLINIIKTDGFELYPLKANITDTVSSLSGDALFLCNSHTTAKYLIERPVKIRHTCSLDSNWLFNNEVYPKYQTFRWIDTCYVLFPDTLFKQNLIENGGFYNIDRFFLKKIITPGFVPSGSYIREEQKQTIRERFKLPTGTKLIGLYFGNKQFHSAQFGSLADEVTVKIYEAVHQPLSESIGPVQIVNFSDPVVFSSFGIHSTEQFNELLASCNLVAMHHGYGTIPKLLHNKIPIISFTNKPQKLSHCSYYELSPLIKSGAILHQFYEEADVSSILSNLKKCLFDLTVISNMKMAQEKVFIEGEDNLLSHFYSQF